MRILLYSCVHVRPSSSFLGLRAYKQTTVLQEEKGKEGTKRERKEWNRKGAKREKGIRSG